MKKAKEIKKIYKDRGKSRDHIKFYQKEIVRELENMKKLDLELLVILNKEA